MSKDSDRQAKEFSELYFDPGLHAVCMCLLNDI